MNSKKAKKLRQLTRVLQEKGVADKEWTTRGFIEHSKVEKSDNGYTQYNTVKVKQSVLKLECGKSMYRAMKKRAK